MLRSPPAAMLGTGRHGPAKLRGSFVPRPPVAGCCHCRAAARNGPGALAVAATGRLPCYTCVGDVAAAHGGDHDRDGRREPDRILLTAGHQPINRHALHDTRTQAGMFAVRALYVQLACVLLLSFIRCSRGTVWFEGWEMEHVHVVGVGWYICNTSI